MILRAAVGVALALFLGAPGMSQNADSGNLPSLPLGERRRRREQDPHQNHQKPSANNYGVSTSQRVGASVEDGCRV